MVKRIFFGFLLIIGTLTAYCQDNTISADSVKIRINGTDAYIQQTVKVDSNIRESMIYLRSLQFMAVKNFQQTYGFDQEGRLICTTMQDLNNNRVYIGDESDNVDPYTVQFSIVIDMKNARYRYTITNVVFFLPTETGNRRLTLYDIYEKATNTDSKRVARDNTKLLESFKTYIATLGAQLYMAIEHRSAIDSSKF